MTKSAITRLFVGSVIAVIAGMVLGFVALMVAFTGGAFVMDGPDVAGVAWSPFAGTMIGTMALAGLTVIGGFIGGLVSWIGALLNTAQLTDKTWFVLLLVLGLCSFGLVAMIAYVLAGPDSARQQVVAAA